VRLRSLVPNLLLAFGSAAAVLVVLELGLRAAPSLLPEEAQLRVHWRQMAVADSAKTRPDPEVGFLYPAGVRGRIAHTSVEFGFQMDSRGFRNPGPWPGRADVVAVGDSWVFSYGVDDDEAWPRLVGDGLPGIRVMNLGLSGLGPEQYTRVYQRFGVPLHPKLLLYGLFPGNDLIDTGDFARWLEAGSPGNYNTWRTADRMPRLDLPIIGASYLALLVGESWKNRHARFGSRTVTWQDGHHLRLAGNLYSRDAEHAHPGDPEFDGALAALERARALAAAQGTRVLVLLFPTKEEVYLPLLGDSVPKPVAPFAAELDRRGVEYIDFTGSFAAQARAGRSIYFEVDPHPNREGYRLIADSVTAYLRRHAATLGLTPRSAAAVSARSE
jgi:lysophospholipase L1-like esterase